MALWREVISRENARTPPSGPCQGPALVYGPKSPPCSLAQGGSSDPSNFTLRMYYGRGVLSSRYAAICTTTVGWLVVSTQLMMSLLAGYATLLSPQLKRY